MKSLLLFATATIIGIQTYAQGITIPYDTAPVTVDGRMSTNEWNKAASVAIIVSGTDSVQVYYKHDMAAMYFAFTGKLESANALFPEVLFDPQLAKGNSWVNGQWWFHVSATDCDNNGGYGVYSNCKLVQPDWQGANNFAAGAPYTDTVEMKIPFSKIGFNPSSQNDMGIAFLVTNTATIYKLWPSAADKSVPSTWSHATISKVPAGVKDATAGMVKVYPNPANTFLTVEGSAKGTEIRITDISGKTVLQQSYTGQPVNIQSIVPGIYNVMVYDNGTLLLKHSLQKL